MLKREHFFQDPNKPIQWFTMAPVHPILAKQGSFDVNLAFKCLDDALRLTIEDAKELPKGAIKFVKRRVVDGKVRSVPFTEISDSQIAYDWINDKMEDKEGVTRFSNDAILIEGFPITSGKLEITSDQLELGVAETISLDGRDCIEYFGLNLPK